MSELLLLGTGVGVDCISVDEEGTVDVLDCTDSIEVLEEVGIGVVVGVPTAAEEVSVELITEEVETAEVVTTTGTGLELVATLEGAMEEVVLKVVDAIELVEARQSVTA